MSKYIVIPDSFKGTMTSSEICRIMRDQIIRHDANASVVSVPVADGGEGSVDCFLEAVGGKKILWRVCGVFPGETVEAYYGLLADKKTAVVEMAACAGLPLAEGRLDPLAATTYGVGELILHAAESGAETILAGLGGSATNDGGCGAAAACGCRFINAAGEHFIPTGGTLTDIAHIDLSGFSRRLANVRIIAMCDIDNPLFGPDGAAFVFAPQKGADPPMVDRLDHGLRHLSAVIRREFGRDIDMLPGAGAAGGLGAGMAAFFGAPLQKGIETVLDTVDFDRLLDGADLVLTGEGRLDKQSLRGKVVVGVARRAKKAGIPVIAVVGDIGDDIDPVYGEGVTAVLSINRVARDFQDVRGRARGDLSLTIDTLMRIRKCREAAKNVTQ